MEIIRLKGQRLCQRGEGAKMTVGEEGKPEKLAEADTKSGIVVARV
jgi:hypothetical protein